jgi:L-amino acid N-acyltransferase
VSLPASEGPTVRMATRRDVAAITEIFNELIGSTSITWSEHEDSLDDRLEWFARQQANAQPVVVAELDDEVVGFAAYGPFRDNAKWPGYRFTVEHSIHVRTSHHRRGVGRELLAALVAHAIEHEAHVMVAAIDGENGSSIALHERFGFVHVGLLPETGYKFGRWLDLVLMQRTF